MLAGVDDLLAIVASVYGETEPADCRLLRGVRDVQHGEDPKLLAPKLSTTPRRLRALAECGDPVQGIFKTTLEAGAAEKPMTKARRSLGRMLLGDLAEREFERLYKRTLGADELLQLQDARRARTETDYHVINGDAKPVFRLNIKFHGTLFGRARADVDLEPQDCFALGTYKIYQGITKQVEERRPYVFVVVSVPGLTADVAGAAIPDALVHLTSFVSESTMSGKRDLEDAIVRHLIEHRQSEPVQRSVDGFAHRIEQAEWRVISARKADKLLRELLFKRVFAVRQRTSPRTQVNMHFSLSSDLTPFAEFARLRKERGLHGLAVILEAADI